MAQGGPGDPCASLGPWHHGCGGMKGLWARVLASLCTTVRGTDPSLQGLGILQSHNPHGWDGSCSHCGVMGLMCAFPEAGQGMLLGQPKGLGVP